MSGEKPIKGERIEFSSLDSLFVPLNALYFYNSILDVELLQKSLDETVRDIPILSSVVGENENTGGKSFKKYYYECKSPSNVKIITKHLEDESIFDYYESEGIMDLSEGCAFSKHFESCEINDWVSPKLGSPNLRITVIILNNKKSILAVSINHCIADAHSLIYFMNRWSKGSKECLVKRFDSSRKRLVDIMKDDFDIKQLEPKITQPLFLYHPHNVDFPTREEDVGVSIYPQSKVTRTYLHFTNSRIKQLKSLVNVPKGTKFSSNDCISAHIWKLFAALGEDMTQEMPILMIMNFRRRIQGLDDGYFGNASFCPGMNLTKDDVIKLPFTDLVMKIRNLVDSVDDDMVNTTLNCVETYREEYSTAKLMKKTSLYMDDWRLFDRMLPDFGVHKCERGILGPPGALPFFHVQFVFVHLDHGGDGLKVMMTFLSDVFEKIKDFDLTDPKVILKVKEIFGK